MRKLTIYSAHCQQQNEHNAHRCGGVAHLFSVHNMAGSFTETPFWSVSTSHAQGWSANRLRGTFWQQFRLIYVKIVYSFVCTRTHTNCRHTPNSDTPNNHTVATEINEWFAYMRDDDPNRRNDEYTFVGVSVTHRYCI